MKLGPTPLLVVSSPKLAEQVLKIQDSSFCGRPKSLGQQKLSYRNSDIIFSPYNDYWKEMRKITYIHLLSPKRIQSYRPIQEEEISRMITKIWSFFHTLEAVNLNEMVVSFGCNSICRVAFGKECSGRFYELLEDVIFPDYFPAFGWVDRLTGIRTRLERKFRDMDTFNHVLIDEHLGIASGDP